MKTQEREKQTPRPRKAASAQYTNRRISCGRKVRNVAKETTKKLRWREECVPLKRYKKYLDLGHQPMWKKGRWHCRKCDRVGAPFKETRCNRKTRGRRTGTGQSERLNTQHKSVKNQPAHKVRLDTENDKENETGLGLRGIAQRNKRREEDDPANKAGKEAGDRVWAKGKRAKEQNLTEQAKKRQRDPQ